MSVSFSIAGNAGQKTIEGEVSRVVLAEQLGYEGIFVSEGLTGHDPFQVFAVAAARTSRIRLGTAIMTLSFREPMVIACQAATLNEISGGRVIVGMGTGDGTTYTMGRTATPLARFEESVGMLRDLVNGKTIRVPANQERKAGDVGLNSGRFPVPVYVASAGPRSLRVAGRVADGVILGVGFDTSTLDWAIKQIRLGAADVGRDPDEIELMGSGIMCVHSDRERAVELARARLANRAHHNFRFTIETVPEKEVPAVKQFMAAFDVTKPIEGRCPPHLVTDYLIRRFSIAGTPEECVERIRKLEEYGVKRILLTIPPKAYLDVMKLWSEKVMPRV